MTMRERVARGWDPVGWAWYDRAKADHPAKPQFYADQIRRADAALAALETPDEGMVEAGRQYLRVHVDSHAIADDAAGAYTTMIRHARKDGE